MYASSESEAIGESPLHHRANTTTIYCMLTFTGNLDSPTHLCYMFLDRGRRPENLEGTHTDMMGRTCKLHAEKSL